MAHQRVRGATGPAPVVLCASDSSLLWKYDDMHSALINECQEWGKFYELDDRRDLRDNSVVDAFRTEVPVMNLKSAGSLQHG
eukprot:5297739-Amphidinium_carterae.1